MKLKWALLTAGVCAMVFFAITFEYVFLANAQDKKDDAKNPAVNSATEPKDDKTKQVDAQDYLAQADAELHKRNYEKALEYIDKELQKDNPDIDAYEWKWEVRLKMEKERTADEIQKVLAKAEAEKDPKRKESLIKVAIIGAHVLDDKHLLNGLTKKYPDNPAIDIIAQNEFEKTLGPVAIEDRLPVLRDIIENYPKSKRVEMAYQSIIYIYRNSLKNMEMAELWAKKWTDAEPTNPIAFNTYARCLVEMPIPAKNDEATLAREKANYEEKLALAEKLSARAIELDQKVESQNTDNLPDSYWREQKLLKKSSLHDTLAWALFKSKKYEEALKECDLGIKICPNNEILHAHKGRILEKLDRNTLALESYLQAMIIRGTFPDIERALFDLYRETYPAPEDKAPVSQHDILKSLGAKELGENAVTFADITEASGLQSVVTDPKTGKVTRNYIRVARAAVGDYNNDGLPDLLLSGSYLFKNMGDGQFKDVTKETGLDKLPPGICGGVWGDYDNDGHLDFYALYLTCEGDQDPAHHSRLMHNLGNGSFEDVTDKAGKVFDMGPSYAAAWVDVDKDGFLDLYIANYERTNYFVNGEYQLGAGFPDSLWINQRNGTFVNETKKRGIVPSDGADKSGRGVSCADFNDDGNQDIYVCNYRLNPNFFWINDGKGFFTDGAKKHGVQGVPGPPPQETCYGHSIGAAWGDINNDGFLDLVVGNLAHPRYIQFSNMTSVYINGGAPNYNFTDIREKSGIKFEETHSDPSLADYDNDGDLDLYLTSCYVGNKSFLYRNEGNAQFKDVTYLSGVRVDDGGSHVWLDFDNDGDLDLLTSSASSGCRLFKNEGTNNNNYLRVKLVGTKSNVGGVGARVILTVGDTKQIREINAGRGACSQDEMIAHFGLGKYEGKVSVVVQWPSGAKSELNLDKGHQAVTIKEAQ